jgi:hypothetical protein
MDQPSSGILFDGESGVWHRSKTHPWLCPNHAAVVRTQASPGSVPIERGRGCAKGLDESVVRVPPGRTGCIVLRVSIRIDSSIADFDSRHRARSPRWNELGGEVAEVSHDAHLYDPPH